MKDIIYIVHSTSVGDTICSIPTLRKLYQTYLQKIIVVTYCQQVFKNNPYIKEIVDIKNFNKQDYKDYEILESYVLAGKPNEFGMERKFSCVDLRQTHANDLGFQLFDDEMDCEFYSDNKLKLDVDFPNRYVTFHVTKNWPNRTWDSENWQRLIDFCALKKLFVVLIGKDYVESSFQIIDKKCDKFNLKYGIDLTNQGDLSDIWHIINKGRAIVTMDSGPLHIAGTTNTFIIHLGSAKDPRFSAPYRKGNQDYKYLYIKGKCDLFCTSNMKYSIKEWGTIKNIPILINCSENKPTFECQPSVNLVIKTLNYLLDTQII